MFTVLDEQTVKKLVRQRFTIFLSQFTIFGRYMERAAALATAPEALAALTAF